ncbi:cyclin-dependent kinase 4 inhibitor C-like [Pristis pectinata]|uniref:cyclin-dependent kinase 4 inhibitor C-like n=1 Tax=Pristis pectinata TaxID=685728 RepID=UPI00223D9506|nr:cyclin-dependent kinase 4 inhibitor C-like [Pristis pectinata]XP_051876044.1 cyclin-dependent kinase 4 inhibitor C-like [Pristis pectinata]
MANIDELTTAAASGNINRVRELLDNGVDPNGVNKYGMTALQVMKMSRPDICRLLLNRGANPNVQDRHGIALVHDLAREGHLDTLTVLVEEGNADINLRDGNNKQAIDLARENNYPDIVDYLLRRNQAI